jgi:hypothetical protein
MIQIERAWWPGLAALVAANLLPLVGAVAFGWDLGLILLLYWAESAIILLFSLVKVGLVAGAAAAFLIPFFIVHAGIFMLVHLVFIATLFVDRPDAGWLSFARDLGVGAAVLFLSHLVSFVQNAVRRGERAANGQAVMVGFYARIFVMQLTIILGGFLTLALGSPAWALALLVVLKTGADAMAHLRERRKAGALTP